MKLSEKDRCEFLDELFNELKKYDSNETYVIGGAMFYKTRLPYCDEFLITKVDADGGAEVFYENLDKIDGMECVYESEPVESNGYTIKFTTYKNNNIKKF
jgi:dihydrofolate reductase